jgi:hypothetical protein
MLQDPENVYDESITVYAESEAQARAKCEKAAQKRSKGAIVTCLGCIKITKTTGRYVCTIRIEPVEDLQP